jgi:hypothetical protein
MAQQSPILSSRDIVLLDDILTARRDAALFGHDYVFVHNLEIRRQRLPRELRMAELPYWFKPKRILIPHETKVSHFDPGDGSLSDSEFLPVYIAPERALLDARRILISAPAVGHLETRLGVHHSDQIPFDGDKAFNLGQSRYHVLQDFYIACADTTTDPALTLQKLVAKTEGYHVQRTWDRGPVRDQESLKLPPFVEIDRELFFKELVARHLEEKFFWNWKLHAIVASRRDVSDPDGLSQLFSRGHWEGNLANPFEVQMLYRIMEQHNEGFPVCDVSPWIGTGRYSGRVLPQHWRGSLSGLKSSVEKLENMNHPTRRAKDNRKTVPLGPFCSFPDGSPSDRSSQQLDRLVLPEGVIAFLGRLHPDCEDIDLPLRLMEWLELPDGAAEAAMAQYIRTWFGKLFRHQGL